MCQPFFQNLPRIPLLLSTLTSTTWSKPPPALGSLPWTPHWSLCSLTFALIQSVLNTAARVTLLSLPSSKLSEGFLSHPKWKVKASRWPTGPKMTCAPHLTSSPTTAFLSISSTHTVLIALTRSLWVFSYPTAFRSAIPSQKACSPRYPYVLIPSFLWVFIQKSTFLEAFRNYPI